MIEPLGGRPRHHGFQPAEVQDPPSAIAVVGLSGRFPGADTPKALWHNLLAGVESVTFFNEPELKARGMVPALLADPAYVRAEAVLEGIDLFDALFFGMSPHEARITDPQHRLFLECAWEALENAGYAGSRADGPTVAVFAGAGWNAYAQRPSRLSPEGDALALLIGNAVDSLATRVSYRLDLRGPSITVQTACSTSLVAVHLACRSLLDGECDLALAGGVSINTGRDLGYRYDPEGILSPDGHCRAFDARAAGTVRGSGVGVVVLKRLGEAIEAGDTIYAAIRASAVNNDGASKVGFTAPGVHGQASVIAEALAVAGVDPGEVDYVEAHGTGTRLGDLVEIAALTEVFGTSSSRAERCVLGSIKTNLGHLDAAAGIAGLIKAVLAIHHRVIPPTLHFVTPHPDTQLRDSAFRVNTLPVPWENNRQVLRAGVSSFGIGGTNVHVLLESVRAWHPPEQRRHLPLLVLSARTAVALARARTALAHHLRAGADCDLADAAYTLQVGRAAFDHRFAAVCRDTNEAIAALETPASHADEAIVPGAGRSVVFAFPGTGAEYAGMAAGLYKTEGVFREAVDTCARLLHPHLGLDLSQALSARRGHGVTAAFQEIRIAQPALFVTEYALARLWMSWGVLPDAMIGHSVGEYVAACLGNVFSLSDALRLVALRSRLMQGLPAGSMLAVPFSEVEVQSCLDERLSLAAINSPKLCVVSGPADAILGLQQTLSRQGVSTHLLRVQVAGHSAAMAALRKPFENAVRSVELRPPEVPFVSNLSGAWIRDAEATDPGYWSAHLCRPVRFADGIGELLQASSRAFIELGPGRALIGFARQHPDWCPRHVAVTSLPHADEKVDQARHMLASLGALWSSGVRVDWASFSDGERRRRVPLPTYCFDRQRHWIEPTPQSELPSQLPLRTAEPSEWLYVPSWQRVARLPVPPAVLPSGRWLLFECGTDVGSALAGRLRAGGQRVTVVRPGTRFEGCGTDLFNIDPRDRAHYDRLLDRDDDFPERIVHLWSLSGRARTGLTGFTAAQDRGFYSVLFLSQALQRRSPGHPASLLIVTANLHEVTGTEELRPEQATIIGLVRTLGAEHPHLRCRCVDLESTPRSPHTAAETASRLLSEALDIESGSPAAYRKGYRWVQGYARARSDPQSLLPLRQNGVYLITGGLGRMGLVCAQLLAREVGARLVLTGRTARYPAVEDSGTALEQIRAQARLRALRAIEASGGEVMVAAVDVADHAKMAAVVEAATQRWGTLHGVIHAAGELSLTAIGDIATADIVRHFRPKVHGLYVLEQILRGRDLDFCLLTSSLAAVQSSRYVGAYAAANAFLDAFAHRLSRSGRRWVSVNWDGWDFADDGDREADELWEPYRIAPAEGAEAFKLVLSQCLGSQVVVSTGDLMLRAAHAGRQPAEGARPRPTAISVEVAPQAYKAPSNEIEEVLAAAWRELLGLARVGVDDDFFRLGGHSLMAIQLFARIRTRFHVRLGMDAVFKAPTIAGLSELVLEQLIEQAKAIKPAPSTAAASCAQVDGVGHS